jgi:hypothetical protein
VDWLGLFWRMPDFDRHLGISPRIALAAQWLRPGLTALLSAVRSLSHPSLYKTTTENVVDDPQSQQQQANIR